MSLRLNEAAALAREALVEMHTGRVRSVRGMTVSVDDLPLPVGAGVAIGPRHVMGEVVGFESSRCIVMLCQSGEGIRSGDEVRGLSSSPLAGVGEALLGRCVDGLGRPIDDGAMPDALTPRSLNAAPVPALRRPLIDRQLVTGVSAIDLCTPIGRGQRLGVFAGPGVGKSTLLGQIARGTEADVNVIALIGERGREVREFIEHSLGQEGLERSVVVVATSDEPPVLRLRAAKLACAAAEHFRDRGQDVLLMMDSVTRFAHAQRQVGLSTGEPPATRGYTPSVFGEMASLMERAGRGAASEGNAAGSITALYTILVEGDEASADPIADAARGILDGHIMLDRALAQAGRFPAVDVLDSVSRVLPQITSKEHQMARQRLIALLAAHRRVEELVRVGAYARGTDPEADVAIELHGDIEMLLRQSSDEGALFDERLSSLKALAIRAGDLLSKARPQAARGSEAAA